MKKTEIWDLDGAGSAPYSTAVNSYNGRDQVIKVTEYSGSDTSTTYQDTTFEFDGHGRLKRSHKPEQFDTSPSNPTYTQYTYNADDTVATVTDPRGAITTYKYGSIDEGTGSEYRALLTKILYTSPDTTNIPDPTDVVFAYDSAANRISMSDGSGTLSYSYDEISRLKNETKTFLDTLADAPTSGYTLAYTYHLAAGIKSITDPFGAVVTYTADKTGRMTDIGGSGFYDNLQIGRSLRMHRTSGIGHLAG